MYKRCRGVEQGTTSNKSSWWSERDLNSEFPDFKLGARTTKPRYLLQQQSRRLNETKLHLFAFTHLFLLMKSWLSKTADLIHKSLNGLHWNTLRKAELQQAFYFIVSFAELWFILQHKYEVNTYIHTQLAFSMLARSSTITSVRWVTEIFYHCQCTPSNCLSIPNSEKNSILKKSTSLSSNHSSCKLRAHCRIKMERPAIKQYWRPYVCILAPCKFFLVDKVALHDSYSVNHWKHMNYTATTEMLRSSPQKQCNANLFFSVLHVSEHMFVCQSGPSFRGLLMSAFKPDLFVSTCYWQKWVRFTFDLFISFPLLFWRNNTFVKGRKHPLDYLRSQCTDS